MKLADALENYYCYTGKASDISRQLSFAGLAIIWIFKFESGGAPKLPGFLFAPGTFLVLTMLLDLLQYIYAAIAWHIFHDQMEHKHTGDEEFFVPKKLNLATNIFFGAKLVSVAIAYVLLVGYLAAHLA